MPATAEAIDPVQRAADELVAAMVHKMVAERRSKQSDLLAAVPDVNDLLLKVTAGTYQALIKLYDEWDHRHSRGAKKTISVAIEALGFQEIDLVVPDRGGSLPLVVQLLRRQAGEFAKKLAQAPGSLRAVEYWAKHILFDGKVPSEIAASSSSLGDTRKGLDREALSWLRARDFHDDQIWAVMLDGLEVQGRTVVVARGITADGRMLSLGAVEDQTENGEMVAKLLKAVISRGVSERVLWRIDGGKGLRKGIEDACGDYVPTIQRDVEHKVRNVIGRLPDDTKRAKRASRLPGTRRAKNSRGSKASAGGRRRSDRGPHAEYRTEVRERMYAIWNNTPTVEEARAKFDALAQEFRVKAKHTRSKSLKHAYNAAATTLLNDIDSTLTVKGLGFTGRAEVSLQTTNDAENDIRTLRKGNAAFQGLDNVTNFDQDKDEDGEMRLRHVARGLKAIDSTPKTSLTRAATALGRRGLLWEMERPTLSFDGVDIDITKGEAAELAGWWLSPVGIDSRAGPDEAPAESSRVDGNAQWMGTAMALERLGIEDPAGEVTVAGLASAQEGRHFTTHELVRAMPPRTGKNQGASLIRNLHFDLSASSNLARAWHGADAEQRAEIERRLMAGAQTALEEVTRPVGSSFAAVGKVQATYDGSDPALPRLRVVGTVFGIAAEGKRKLLSPAQAVGAGNTRKGREARVLAERLAATHLEDLQPLIEPFQAEFAPTVERGAQASLAGGGRPARDEAQAEKSGEPDGQQSLLDLFSFDEGDVGAHGAAPEAAPQTAVDGVLAESPPRTTLPDTALASAQPQSQPESDGPRPHEPDPELFEAEPTGPVADVAPVPDRLELSVAGQEVTRDELAGLVVERSLLASRQGQRDGTRSLWLEDEPRLAGVPIQAELRFRGQAPPTLTLSLAGVPGTGIAAPVPTSRSRAAALIDRLEKAAIAELPAVMERAAEVAARQAVDVSGPADDRSVAPYTWTLGDQQTSREMVASHIMGSAWQALPETATNGLGPIRLDQVLQVGGLPIEVALRREDGATKVVVGVSGRPETEVTGALSNRANGGLTLVDQLETKLRALPIGEQQDQFWMEVGNEIATSRDRAAELVTQAVLQRMRRAPDRTRELPVGEVGRLAGFPIRAAYVRRAESTHVALWIAGMRQTEVAMPLSEFRTDARALLERLEERVAALPAAVRSRPADPAVAAAATVAGASFSAAGIAGGAPAQHGHGNPSDRVPKPRRLDGVGASLAVGD